ncbi:MAG: redoxin domain-containing protein [Gemmatimonadetes bacterium]|nr:redoxin domain-containing protein [Gemmatimonadota bacterium]
MTRSALIVALAIVTVPAVVLHARPSAPAPTASVAEVGDDAAGSAAPAALRDLTTLPTLDGAQTWINSAPLDAAALKGHVVAVDFWTFLCSNCQAALPYVRQLDADFRGKGLVTIGVHTPELAPERDLANVRKAVTRLGVTYPVAVDPEFTIWNRFNNRYWPSIYVFDKTGKLRYHWDGEGDYAAQRALVAKLLAE